MVGLLAVLKIHRIHDNLFVEIAHYSETSWEDLQQYLLTVTHDTKEIELKPALERGLLVACSRKSFFLIILRLEELDH